MIPRKERPGVGDIMNGFRQQFAAYKDVTITMATWGADVTVTLVGDSTEKLAALGEVLKKDIAQDDRLVDFNTSIQLENPRVIGHHKPGAGG